MKNNYYVPRLLKLMTISYLLLTLSNPKSSAQSLTNFSNLSLLPVNGNATENNQQQIDYIAAFLLLLTIGSSLNLIVIQFIKIKQYFATKKTQNQAKYKSKPKIDIPLKSSILEKYELKLFTADQELKRMKLNLKSNQPPFLESSIQQETNQPSTQIPKASEESRSHQQESLQGRLTHKLIYFAPIFFLLTFFCYSCNQPADNLHLKFGNPTQAGTKDLNNYLIKKSQYVLSYNCANGIPNWVSWQLNQSWLGDIDRQNDFRPDPDLPPGCKAIKPNDYRGSGYDRGHMTPSGDRTKNQQDNSATFLMINMIPQSPANNREVWRELEEYSRKLVNQGKELYIIAGGEGKEKVIASGKVNVPKYTWKVILILKKTGNLKTSQTIAVRIPNSQKVARTDWTDYLVSVDEIEEKTGYNFFSRLPKNIQNQIEQQVYQVP